MTTEDNGVSAMSDELGPLPDPWKAGDLKPDTRVYTADTCWFFAAQEVAKERERWQKWTCRKEWESVNDPPCHPGDKGWRPCETCKGPNARANARP